MRPTTMLVMMVLFGAARSAHAQQACDSLPAVTLANATITAVLVADAPVTGVAGPGAAARPGPVPAHCEVKGVIRPTRDSEIKFVLWLPAAEAWNGKYRQQGNGGWAGVINTVTLVDPLRHGYAVAATDNGHAAAGLGAAWAIGHPE